jgi:hypothetical protein
VVGQQELFQRFAKWLSALHPKLWKEIRQMASTSKTGPVIDWEAVGEIADLGEAVRLLPPERVIEILGLERAIQAIGPEKLLEQLLSHLSPQQIQEIIPRHQQQG